MTATDIIIKIMRAWFPVFMFQIEIITTRQGNITNMLLGIKSKLKRYELLKAIQHFFPSGVLLIKNALSAMTCVFICYSIKTNNISEHLGLTERLNNL